MTFRPQIAAVLGCLSLFATGAATPPAPAASDSSAAGIAHRIFTGTRANADAAMAEVFGGAGVATIDAEGKVVGKAIAPTLPIRMRAFEMHRAAVSLRGAPVTTLAEIGEKLFEMGAFAPEEIEVPDLEAAGAAIRKKMENGEAITDKDTAAAMRGAERMTQGLKNAFGGGPDGSGTGLDAELAGVVLRDILRKLVGGAHANPKSPHSFVPLLLESLAKERATRDGVPAVDLSSDEVRPEDVEFTLTEAQLFLLMFLRGRTSSAAAPVRYAALGMPLLASGGTPCSDLVDKMGDFGKAVPHASGKAGDVAGDIASEILGEFVGHAGRAVIGYATKAFRLLTMMMDSTEWELDAAPPVAHWSHKKGSPVEVTLNAKVTLPPAGDPTDAEAVDCLNTALALDLPNSPQAMAKSMKDWRVYWDLARLDGHATVSETKNKLKYHAPLGGDLEVIGQTGRAKLVLDVREEDLKADLRGKQRKANVRVTAALDQSAAIDPTIILTAALKAPDAIQQVLTEWAKKLTPKTTSANIKMTWHEPKLFAWEGTITEETTLSSERDLSQVTPGRAPPAIAIGVSIPAPGEGVETFHDEGHATRTMTVKAVPGHDGERIHPYSYVSKDHALSRRKETTPEVCSVANGSKWRNGLWTADYYEKTDIELEGKGFTTVDVKFSDDGTYSIDAPIPYASGWLKSEESYLGKSSCTGEADPENRPLGHSKIYGKIGPYRLFVHGTAKADAKVLQGSTVEPLTEKGLGASGSTKTTWNLKRVVVEWSGE